GDVALLDLRVGKALGHAHHDDVAEAGIAAPRASEHLDAADLTGAGVVGYLELALHLDHGLTSLAQVAFDLGLGEAGLLEDALGRGRNELGHDPALLLRKRTRLLDLDAVAVAILVGRVVRLVALAGLDVLLVLGVLVV